MRFSIVAALLFSTQLALAAEDTDAPPPEKKRPTILFLQPEIGSSYTNLKVFYGRDLAFSKTSDGGILVGASGGVNIPLVDHHALVLGAYGRIHGVSGYNVKQYGGLAGWRYGEGGTGGFVVTYVGPILVDGFDTSALSPQTTPSASDLQLSGFSVGFHGGGDIALGKWFSIGVILGIDVMTWSRPRLPLLMGANPVDPLYARDGAGTGLALTCALRVGFAGF